MIDLELLSRPDPILFYDEIPLFESELDDNGTSILSARVVSPTPLNSFYHPILSFFFFRNRKLNLEGFGFLGFGLDLIESHADLSLCSLASFLES